MVAGKLVGNTHAQFPEIYNPHFDTMSTLTFAQKLLPLYPFMFLLPDGNVFFAGHGSVAGEQLKTFVLFMDQGQEQWDELNPYITDYWAKDGTAVMYEPGKIMRIGGDTAGETLNTVELINFNDPNPEWTSDNDGVATMQYARYDHQAVLLADGTVLVIGGKDSLGGNITKPELYDPVANTWTGMADMSYPRYNHSIALLLPDGKVLSAGGDECNINSEDSNDCGQNNGIYCTAEVFAPPYLFEGPRPVIGFAPTTISYILDFVVTLSTTSPVGNAEIAKVSLVRLGSMTHNFDQNQRYVSLAFTTEGIGPENSVFITAPANGNIAPRGYYMLFLISDAGVPSLAKFVNFQ